MDDTNLLERALAWLAANPDSSARTIADALGVADDRIIWRLLDNAAYDGRCQRSRYGSRSPWLWEVPA